MAIDQTEFHKVESILGPEADDVSSVLEGRIDQAAQYALGWVKEGHKGALGERPQRMLQRLSDLKARIHKDAPFPGKTAAAEYAQVSKDWAQLTRDMTLATDTLPQPSALGAAIDTLAMLAKSAGAGLGITLGAELFIIGGVGLFLLLKGQRK